MGIETHDDAGVYRLSPELALIQTVDYFTPVVDDPFDYGAIAAANALSDVYAMGGTPLTVLNIVGWPQGELDWEVLRQILRGSQEVVHEAGAVLAGGHSVKSPELFFGLSVTGSIHPDRVVTNAGGRAGDRLFLTKPLGTGVLTTALKKGRLEADSLAAATASMRALNAAAAAAMQEVGAHAATDVTGYGLLGHLLEMARPARLIAEIDPAEVPLLPRALEHARAGDKPGGLTANRGYVAPSLSGEEGFEPARVDLLCDPQTSGGLLIAVGEEKAAALASALAARSVQSVAIGRFVADRSNRGGIRLRAGAAQG